MLQEGIYASNWPLDKQSVWAIVNRSDYDATGPQMEVPADPGVHCVDLYHGVEITPMLRDNQRVLSFDIEAKGFGAVFASTKLTDAVIKDDKNTGEQF